MKCRCGSEPVPSWIFVEAEAAAARLRLSANQKPAALQDGARLLLKELILREPGRGYRNFRLLSQLAWLLTWSSTMLYDTYTLLVKLSDIDLRERNQRKGDVLLAEVNVLDGGYMKIVYSYAFSTGNKSITESLLHTDKSNRPKELSTEFDDSNRDRTYRLRINTTAHCTSSTSSNKLLSGIEQFYRQPTESEGWPVFADQLWVANAG
ncbi:unnamed protein product [Nippostrongylus brasiliensis]|uniref:Uncharacterized protein n=1 Tax=Nippostrongylus brasiliensis TaxID=27835 RepID=A0A158QYQ4_NIPBR|nr:unnamed protein product [Nippostrongylus brasiliensis]